MFVATVKEEANNRIREKTNRFFNSNKSVYYSDEVETYIRYKKHNDKIKLKNTEIFNEILKDIEWRRERGCSSTTSAFFDDTDGGYSAILMTEILNELGYVTRLEHVTKAKYLRKGYYIEIMLNNSFV